MNPKFDATNWRIIAKLVEDGRQPYRQIAEDLNISESTVRKRVQKMIDEGIINRFTIELNPQAAHPTIVTFIKVSSASQRDLEAIKDFGMQHPNVAEVYELAGQCGILLKVVVETVEELNEFKEIILDVSGADGFEHCILLKQLKYENRSIKLEI
jgi:DNA-binding Lrp family transcriptional regulator